MHGENREMSNFYCIWVKTGFENKFIERIKAIFESIPGELNGKFHCIGKQMRLKSGKEYIEPLIPGYIFWETDNLSRVQVIRQEEVFIDFLPNGKIIKPLSKRDTELVSSFLKYGSVIPIINVQFDVNDRIVIVDGLFKGMEGFISDVNRSNKRINFEVTLMDGKRILSLSYQEIQKKEV